ncbi:MAG: ATP-binding protein [Blastocatellales bacterium]
MRLTNWKYKLIGNQKVEDEQYPEGTFLITPQDMQPDAQLDKTRDGHERDSQLELEKKGMAALPADRIAPVIEMPPQNDSSPALSSQPSLAAILERTPDFVGIADREGRLLFVNAAGRRMAGLEQADALASMTMLDFHPEWACRIINQEGIPSALQNGYWAGETAALSPGGVEIPVSQVIIAHRNSDGQVEYFSTILRDITERKRAEMIQVRLRHQAALRAAVSLALAERGGSLPEVLRQCAEAMTQFLDVALTRIWLSRPEEMALELVADAGTRTEEVAASEFDAGQFDINWIAETMFSYSTSDALNDQRIGNQEWIRREQGATFAAFPLKSEDKLIGALAVFARCHLEDDTLDELASLAGMMARGVERRRDDEELAQSLARERAARLAAEEASRLKDDFLAIISHELRAPLTSILGWTQMLRAGALDEASVARALHTIERNVTTQAHLVGDLLDASRMAAGNLQIEMRPVDLASVIESAVDAVRPLIQEKRLRLQISLEPWVGSFNGDQERLKQVMWNLLSNAIKFTPPEGLIEIRLERLEDKALLIVSDTGQGISPEFLPHVFDRFRQADGSSTRKHARFGGLGLGLAIVKRLVELHGGAIYPYSRGEGQGCDFMITFPLATRQQAGHETSHRYIQTDEGTGDERSSALGGVRILVVDDEFDTREVLGAMLARYGAEVRAVESAAEAIRVLVKWNPDVLVSDVGLPGEDGYELIKKVRALHANQGGAIPAIALTAYAGSQDRQRALSNGFQTHLAKPIEPVQLARIVARAAGRDVKAIV